MRKKKEIPLPSTLDRNAIYSLDSRMQQVEDALKQMSEEYRMLRIEDRKEMEFIMKKLGAMKANLDVILAAVMRLPLPSSPVQLMMRETLDKEGKVMTREFIPVPRRSAL